MSDRISGQDIGICIVWSIKTLGGGGGVISVRQDFGTRHWDLYSLVD